MFRSVEDQLEQHQAAAEAAAAPGDDTEEVPQYSYQELRELAAEYIRTHKEEFAPFLLPEDPDQDPEEYYEKYCEKLEGTAVWGGHVELHALAGVLQRQIKVYAANMSGLSVGDEFVGEGKPKALQLCYLEHAFGLGEHYNSVKQLRFAMGGEEEDDGGEAEGGDKKVRWARPLTDCDDEGSD
jgi:OTU domain-containing protein 6